jgi:hypothetical protein
MRRWPRQARQLEGHFEHALTGTFAKGDGDAAATGDAARPVGMVRPIRRSGAPRAAHRFVRSGTLHLPDPNAEYGAARPGSAVDVEDATERVAVVADGYPAVRPPSMLKTAPVRCDASSDHRCTAKAATSSGRTSSPSGTLGRPVSMWPEMA